MTERRAIRLLSSVALGFVVGCNAIIGLELGEPDESVGIQCSMSSHCDDMNPCTADECADGVCKSTKDDTLAPNDGNECTADTCVNGAAMYAAQPGLPCGEGGLLECNTQGQCAGCVSPDQCGESSACEAWACDASLCVTNRLPAGTELTDPTPGDCKTMACDGFGNAAQTPKDDDLPPDDGVECTESQCNGGEPASPPSPMDTVCAGATTYCNASGACVPCTATIGCMNGQTCFNEMECVSCSDGVQNGDETGVDCGGSNCLACDGQPCAAGADCASTFCIDGVCCAASCDGACRSCDLPGLAGTCAFIPQGSEDSSPVCNNSTVCNGAGACVADQGKGHYGEDCEQNNDCFNGTCDLEVCRLKQGDPCSTNIECDDEICVNNVCGP